MEYKPILRGEVDGGRRRVGEGQKEEKVVLLSSLFLKKRDFEVCFFALRTLFVVWLLPREREGRG